ncbi:unnamed protein product [Adineta ricciae]|uniref:Uncharacterized protein n=1 Tax=Adineta ricciae TaxID=249248 RepID=A0A815NEB2_ADIRI|nr:unnamed protein product [Adineta ricciae]
MSSINEMRQFLPDFPNLIHFEIKILDKVIGVDMYDGDQWKMNEITPEQYLNFFRTQFWITSARNPFLFVFLFNNTRSFNNLSSFIDLSQVEYRLNLHLKFYVSFTSIENLKKLSNPRPKMMKQIQILKIGYDTFSNRSVKMTTSELNASQKANGDLDEFIYGLKIELHTNSLYLNNYPQNYFTIYSNIFGQKKFFILFRILIIELYYVHRINFQSIRKSTFHLICQSILPERIFSLVLSDQNDTCGQSKFFLSHFQIEQFTNLRSIKLIKLEHESLCRLLPNLFKLKQLQSLSLQYSTRIQMHINSEDKKASCMLDWSPLHQLCNQVFPQLTNLSTLFTTNLTTMHFPNLLHLDLRTIVRGFYISKIFQHAPRLKSLTIDLIYLYEFTLNQPCYSLKQLNVTSTLHFQIQILNISLQCDVLNGRLWKKIAQPFSTFHFKFFALNDLNEQVLNSFRTRFWIEEKRWFVVCQDRCLFTITGVSLAYTNVTSNQFLYSTVPNYSVIYQPRHSSGCRRNLRQDNFRLTSIKTLELYWNDTFEILSSFIDLNQIESLLITSRSYHLLKHLHDHMSKLHTLYLSGSLNATDLFETQYVQGLQLKQIRTLKLNNYSFSRKTCNDAAKISHLFPCVEHIDEWPIRSRSEIIYVIDQFKQLTSISFTLDYRVHEQKFQPEFNSNLIITDIKKYIHCRATCCFEISWRIYSRIMIHIWLEERVGVYNYLLIYLHIE